MWANDCQIYCGYLHLEHSRIQAAVAAIEAAYRESKCVDKIPRLGPQLEQLHALLLRHFEQEEDGGCLEQAACCCPRLSPAVQEITGEQPSLLEQLQELIRMSHEGLTSADVRTFTRQLAKFTKQLQSHDEAEHRILEAAFGSD